MLPLTPCQYRQACTYGPACNHLRHAEQRMFCDTLRTAALPLTDLLLTDLLRWFQSCVYLLFLARDSFSDAFSDGSFCCRWAGLSLSEA